MLKVVIDATPITSQPSGVGFHLLNLIDNLSKIQSSKKFQLGISYQPGFKNWLLRNLETPPLLHQDLPCYHLPLPIRISNIFLDYFPTIFPYYFEPILDKPDIFHGTYFNVYPFQKTKKVINIYDLTFLQYPQYIDSAVKPYRKRIKKCLQWTDLVITSAENTKKEIIEYLEVEPNKIWVTPLASRYNNCQSLRALNNRIELKYKLYLSKPYILFVGTIEPRKNLNNLIKAFNYLKEKEKIEHNLIIIGQKGWLYESIFSEIANSSWQDCICHLGYLSDELVALFYQQADVFVYPSHYEGFGLPVLESMTLGTPVVTSNTSSLPEVAGDAAILIDSKEPINIAEAVFKILSDSQLNKNLIEKGKERSKQFSWMKTALTTLKAYESLF